MLQFLCEDAANGGDNKWMTWVFVGLLVVLVAALLIVPMFTNKKRAKQDNERYNSLRPGDVIKTVGGIIGTIIEVRQVSPTEKEMVIETGVGDNKTTMVFDIQALYQIMSKAAAPEVPAAPATETNVEEKTEDSPAVVEQPEITEPVADEAPAAETVTEPETAATAEPTVSEETAAADDTVTEPVEAPVKKPTKSSAGKSTQAGKSSSAGKSATKKTTKK